MQNIIFLIIVLALISCKEGSRKRIVIIDSGVSKKIDSKFLCGSGHKSFVDGSLWQEDVTGHGTLMAKIITEKINPQKYCLVILKTSAKWLESDKRAEGYAKALMYLASFDFDLLLLSLEDKSYFFKEIEWLNNLLTQSKVQIVVAAGNGREQLRENYGCNVYPACLKPKLINNSRFHIVGSTDGRFNQGNLVSVRENPDYKGESGTSISAARFLTSLTEEN